MGQKINKIKKSKNKSNESKKFHNKIENLLKKLGFEILESSYTAKGRDMIVRVKLPEIDKTYSNHIKIVVQVKHSERRKIFSGLDKIVDEYSHKRKKLAAEFALIVLGGYDLPTRVKNLKNNKLESNYIQSFLKKDRVLVINDSGVEYLKVLARTLREWAVYPILSELGYKRIIGPEIVTRAIKITQGKSNLFVFKLKPSELLKIADVLRKENTILPDAQTYQRMIEPKHLEEIAYFIREDDALLPNNIIIAFSGGTKMDRDGKLHIPVICGSATVIDGQHRLYSFCSEGAPINSGQDFELICVGFNISNDSKSKIEISKEADIFYNINEKAKKVSPDLLIALLDQLGSGDKVTKVISKLIETKSFKNLIYWRSKRLYSGQIHITTLARNTAIKRIIKDDFSKSPISKYYRLKINQDPCDVYFKVLKRYFDILNLTFKQERNRPNNIIFSDRGIRIFLRLFIDLFEYSDGLKNAARTKAILIGLKKNINFNLDILKKNNSIILSSGEGGADLAYSAINKIIINKVASDFPIFPADLSRATIINSLDIKRNKENISDVNSFIKTSLLNLQPFDNGTILGELRYVDETTFDFLKYLPHEIKIKIDIGPVNSGVLEKVKEERKKLNSQGINLSLLQIIETSEGQTNKVLINHNNPWISGKNYCIEIGTDLKKESLGAKGAFIRLFNNPDALPYVKNFIIEQQSRKEPKEGSIVTIKRI